METFTITPRKSYVDKILSALRQSNLVFVLGVRRSGKSCISVMLEQELEKENDSVVMRFNFEMTDVEQIDSVQLAADIAPKIVPGKTNYLLFDEIVHLEGWESVVERACALPDCKVVLFSSQRRVVSPALSAVANGDYSIVHALPLSLREFIRFQGIKEITPPETPVFQKRYLRGEKTYSLTDIYKYYIIYGGLPIMKPEYTDRERAWVLTDGSYSAVITHDILEIGSRAGESAVTDPLLLRCIIAIMARSVGENTSATAIKNRAAEMLRRTSSTKTVESYMRAILNAHLFYIAERFDIKSGNMLKTLAKYYVVDAGLHNYLTGVRARDEGRLLENKVFFELLRRGYNVFNGKLGGDEINLIAMSGDERIYVQVVDSAGDRAVNAALALLRKIRDNHPKVIITFLGETGMTKDGIRILNALEFLMGASLRR